MDSENHDVELLNVTINKLTDDQKSSDEEDKKLLLSRLLSELESVKREQEAIRRSKGVEQRRTEEIAEEIKKVRRQNAVTHWLLSALIAVTLAWQISEVSLILRLKEGLNDGLNHPFKYIGGMVAGIFRRPRPSPEEGDAAKPESVGLADVVPQLKVPELPSVEFPDLIPGGERP